MTALTRRPSALIAAVALALLLGLQPVTTDLYLPALPAIQAELHASMHATQLTMAALLLAFGFGQLVAGPVADRFGRRPVLLTSLSVYLLASFAAVLAHTIEALVLVRVVQGAVMAGVVVVARAMVRDLYAPHEGARIMSLGMSGLGVIAIASPLLGGWLAGHLGWHMAFVAAAVIALGTLGFVATQLPETLRQKNPQALHPGPLLDAWATVLRHPTFRAWAGLSAATYGGLFVFLAGSSFVYMQVLGLSAAQYGLALGTSSLAYLAGTFVCRRWLVRHGMVGAVRRAAWFTLAGGLSMAALAAAGVQTVWAVLVPQLLFAFGHGTHQACGQTGAVGPFPQQAGVASALAGFVLAVVAFGIGQWLGQALDGTTKPLAYGVAAGSVVTVLIAWTTVQRHGDAP
ncbi:multidrug effflux MFS transporter [Sphaerotilus sp.]|uniref:multidrug effflux MFS transporter n=1 Tax=Sphaerotilus sp. TaxID=2093942 RepID=UPI0025F7F849|nr:multidrug effflux MFS transporter [Sphaerotilus sp.]